MDPELILILDTVSRVVEALSFPIGAAILAIGGVAGIRIWRRRAGSAELEALRDELHQLRASVDDLTDDQAHVLGRVEFAERLLTAPDNTPAPVTHERPS